MDIALWLLAAQGIIGAFDTLYYHEWRAQLPTLGAPARPELRLHAARGALYGVLFATLPWIAWQGGWALVLALVLTAEIIITLQDFAVEVTARKGLGDVYAGERVTHAVMAIIYGAMLSALLPALWVWAQLPPGLVVAPPPIPDWLRWGLGLMATGVLISGLRDGFAGLGYLQGWWPGKAADRSVATR